MLTQKKCKGTGKAIGHGCGQMVPQVYYGAPNRILGLGNSCGCYPKWLLDTKEGQERVNRSQLKAKKEVEKKQKAKDKKAKEENKDWKKPLQLKVQEIARLIDFGLNCLARQIPMKKANGGHVLSKGGHTQIRFNLHNIHRQSEYSNTYKNDDDLMKEGVEREYGKEYLDFIKGLVKYPVPKLSQVEYMEAYQRACKIANSLKKNKRERTPSQRITMRNEVNKEIGIYEDIQNEFVNLSNHKGHPPSRD